MTLSSLTIRQAQLDELKVNASRTQVLEQEVKEKNLLIGKLRHEGLFHHHAYRLILIFFFSRYPQ
jgi:hypothetical protein